MRVSIPKQSLLPTLMMDPCSECRVFGVLGWDQTMSTLYFELGQLPEPFDPCRFLHVSTKTEVVELSCPLRIHSRGLSRFNNATCRRSSFTQRPSLGYFV